MKQASNEEKRKNPTELQSRVKVLHIITNLAVGGAQDNMLLTVERLNRQKYDVSLLTGPEGQWLDRAKGIKNLNLILVESFIRKIHPIKDLVTLYKIYNRIKKGGYVIVHMHTSKAAFLGRFAAKLARVPIILYTMHGVNFNDCIRPIPRFVFLNIERLMSGISDKLITVSKSNLMKFFNAKIAPRDKFIIIYNGIDFQQFNIQIDIKAKRKEIGIYGDEKIVGTVGRLFLEKAPQDFVRAIQKVVQVRKDVVFIFVGDGDLLDEVQTLSQRLNVASYIKFLGYRQDIAELLKIMDVFVLTSVSEGMPRSLAEAMCAERPVVVTDAGGTPELVTNGETGILVPPKDIDAIAQGIVTLLTDQGKAKRMGEAAKKRVTQEFSIEMMVKKIEELYDQLLEEKIGYRR